MQHLGKSKKPTLGLGLTVKYRNNCTISLSERRPLCAGPVANSSTDINGNRMLLKARPMTSLWLAGVAGICLRLHSASDQRSTAANIFVSLIRRVSLGKMITEFRVGVESFESLVFAWVYLSRTICNVSWSMSVNPSATRASAVFLSMVSRHSAASCCSSKSRA